MNRFSIIVFLQVHQNNYCFYRSKSINVFHIHVLIVTIGICKTQSVLNVESYTILFLASSMYRDLLQNEKKKMVIFSDRNFNLLYSNNFLISV